MKSKCDGELWWRAGNRSSPRYDDQMRLHLQQLDVLEKEARSLYTLCVAALPQELGTCLVLASVLSCTLFNYYNEFWTICWNRPEEKQSTLWTILIKHTRPLRQQHVKFWEVFYFLALIWAVKGQVHFQVSFKTTVRCSHEHSKSLCC